MIAVHHENDNYYHFVGSSWRGGLPRGSSGAGFGAFLILHATISAFDADDGTLSPNTLGWLHSLIQKNMVFFNLTEQALQQTFTECLL